MVQGECMGITGKLYRTIFHTRISGVLFFLLLLVIWELAATYVINRQEVPPFSAIIIALINEFPDKILPSISATLGRYFMGYTLAIFIGVSIGMMMGFSRKIHAILESC